MGDLTKEQFEQLPDFVKEDYQEVDGVYKHAGVLKMKGTLNDLDGKLKQTQSQYEELSGKLSDYEKDKQAAIEEARTKALEEARTKGDVDAIEKRYKEQMADLEKRVEQRTRESVEKEFSVKSARSKADADLAEIVAALRPVDDDAALLIKDHLKFRQQVTEDGKIVYLNDDGSDTSLDKSGFLAEMRQNARLKRLIQGSLPSTSPGLPKGSKGGDGSASTIPRAQFEAMNSQQKMTFVKNGGKVIN